MHLATLVVSGGGTRAAVRRGDAWLLLNATDVGALIQSPTWRDQVAAADADRRPFLVAQAGAVLATPVPRPAKVICCGLNYRDHILETGREEPEYPTLFAKYADTLTGPRAEIRIDGSSRVDWEAELAVVVGDAVRRVTREEAKAAILGYAVANDVSCRDWQSRTLQWFQGKAWDRTTPVGPVVVTADEVDPSEGLRIEAEIGDERVQSSNTRELVFDAAALVAYISQFTALAPGDIVLTGTPGGVGMGREPQRFLRDGEILRTRIEGIGTLVNRIRIASADSED